MCWNCLENLMFCYSYLNKLRSANSNLKYSYQECLNDLIQYLENRREELPEDELSSLIIKDLNEVDSQDILEEATYMVLFPATNKSSYLKTTKSVMISRDNVAGNS